MIFYHFTSRENLPLILEQGLTRGEAPLSDTRVVSAVNLTTDRKPAGHGLDKGGHIVTAHEAAMYRAKGMHVPEGTVFADKLEVRLTVKISMDDRHLKKWLPWAHKHCEAGYPERLANAAGGMAKGKTWWLYFGVIPPGAIIMVDHLKPPPEA